MAQQHRRRTPPRAAATFNRLAIHLAGTRWLPVWAVVRHIGRRSGRSYDTPVAVIPGDGVFYIGLPWGRDTDWVRNLRAAGGGTVVWKGREYAVSDPTFVDKAEVLTVAGTPRRQVLARWSLRDFLRLRRVPADG